MATFEIPANTSIATPSKISVDLVSVESKDKNAAGATVIDRVATKRKLNVEWNYISASSLATLLTNTNTATFTVKYPDPVDNAAKTITCIRTSVNTGTQRIVSGTPVWTDVKMVLEEQ